ncbi:MAG: hypothetical protein NZ585_13770 [Chloracidobacterium sp.]|nr:hypothetical protein [Chloracidobacterium sp.]MDW8217913.1 CocE/NonD family hydrolase [Acidobacteriota bacterium]
MTVQGRSSRLFGKSVGWAAWLCLLSLPWGVGVLTFCAPAACAAASKPAHQGLSLFAKHRVTCAAQTVPTPRGPTHAWLYRPEGLSDAPALVMVHGVHRDGADEVRLKNFAQTLAATGMVVLTPNVQSLADYRIEKSAVEIIGWSAKALRRQTGRRVGVMGLSFAGGLCLVAAADRRFAPEIGYVLAVGAHDDLQRVTRFLLTNEILAPNGETIKLRADPYGVLLLAYEHATTILPPSDVETGRAALRFWLWGQPEQARLAAARMSLVGRERVEKLFDGDYTEVTPPLLRQIERRTAAMREVSPHYVLGRIRCPVFLVHGTNDAVVPPSETQWLARGLGGRCRVLISRAVGHVEVTAEATPTEKLEVAQFLGDFLNMARAVR